MLVEKDYEEILRFFNKHKVRYCIVGAFAVAFHGHPRYTKDIDILIDASEANSEKIIAAINELGFSSLKLKKEDFTTPGQIIQLGFEPVRIDILTSISGTSFEQVWKTKIEGRYGKQRVYFISKRALINAKKKTGRKQDEADIEKIK